MLQANPEHKAITDLKPKPDPRNKDRQRDALLRRVIAAQTNHAQKVNVETEMNGDEDSFQDENYPSNFTKGLEHGENGLVKAGYEAFTHAINRQNDGTETVDDFEDLKPDATFNSTIVDEHPFWNDNEKAVNWRGWESPRTGQYFDIQGPDADAVGMAPAPELGSAELTAEMAEVYAMALLRDVTFADIKRAWEKTPPPGSLPRM